ncbi:MAG: HAD-IIB family hydrolase [Alistipes sp.]|jgi:Cof subfamily protein (haloacid dehalogenase superfamily)|nr:HAD-IIB family hydrolase [Alistipes sp.]
MKRRYIFFDIDGTLVAGGYGNSYIPESTILALDKLRRSGHFLAIATGRAQAMAVDYMRSLGFRNMVSDGGYGVTIEDELLDITPLPKDKVVALIDECKAKGFAWALQVNNSTVRSAPDNRFEEQTNDIYMRTEVVEGLDPRNYPALYKAYIACNAPDEQKLVSLRDLPWLRFFDNYIFVEPSDKSFGIRRIMDHFNAPYSDVVVFGDAANDLSMFVDGWTKVAMGNAIDELKARADYVTTNVECDGIYNACVALGLFDEE